MTRTRIVTNFTSIGCGFYIKFDYANVNGYHWLFLFFTEIKKVMVWIYIDVNNQQRWKTLN